MGLRCLIGLLLVEILLWSSAEARNARERRQTSNNYPNQPSEKKAYQPPLPLAGPPVPAVAPATIQNSYQPPISLIRSNEYHSPLNVQHNPYPANPQHGYQPPQSYVLPNQPPSYSVQYTPPANQQSFSVYQQPAAAPNPHPLPPAASLATSYSVQQQPSHAQGSPAQSFPILSDTSGLPQSTAERTYSTHSKVVGSSHVPVQAIHKAPASEIQPDKGSQAKEKDNKNDEYVVYYYYYYDNDTTANNNLSLNFDDIPSLEAYDNDKNAKEPEKSASARTLAANVNALTPVSVEPKKESSAAGESSSSQPRSASGGNREAYIHADRPSNPLEETVVQPLKPISNVFRYGSNEVPRFPVLPNFIVTEVPTTERPGDVSTPDTLTSDSPTTQPAQVSSQLPDLRVNEDSNDDDLNNVLDNSFDAKSNDEKIVEEEPQTSTTTTTTEATTTTEIPTTTTTERPRRRPSLSGGSRRRFSPTSSGSSSFSSNRNRQTPTRGSTSSTTSTTTTTTSAPTRRSFQSSRQRPRPSLGSNRPRGSLRTTENSDDKAENKAESKAESKAPEVTTTSTTASTRSRFTSASPRRFQSSRSRSQTSSTTSTTRAPPSPSAPRSRPTSRPRPNLITRNRPPRPGFLRPRPGSEPEVPETTTVVPEPTEEETSPGTNEELPSTNNDENGTEEEEETSEEETEEPTTTEGNRFSALFRPRNRNALGNRPRPVIGNRPSRS